MFKNFAKKQVESESAIKEFNAIDDIERPYDPELDTIEYLRSLDKKEYEKIITALQSLQMGDGGFTWVRYPRSRWAPARPRWSSRWG